MSILRIGGHYVTVMAICLMVLMSLAGCTTTSAEVAGKKGWAGDGAPILQHKSQVDSSIMASEVEVVSVQNQLVGDMMRAQVAIRSKSSGTLKLQYRFDWLDAQGIEINANKGSWNPLILYARDTSLLQGVTPDPRAKEFRLKLRPLDE